MSIVVGNIAAMVREPSGRPSERAVRFWTWDAAVGWAVFVIAATVHVAVMPRWRYRAHRRRQGLPRSRTPAV